MAAAKDRPRRDGIPSLPGACRRLAIARARSERTPTATSFAAAGGVRSDEPLEQERAVRRGAPDRADRGDELLRREADAEDLVAHVHDLSGDGWPHHRSPRRAQ